MPSERQLFAAIDIGSNAIRMVIAERSGKGFKTLKKYRLPIRLGADVFATGHISPENLQEAAQTFQNFKELTQNFGVKKVRAIGTSALREAKNQKAFLDLMEKKSGIRIEVIDGFEEAKFIHLAVKHAVALEKYNALLIDIGGGSVELSFSRYSKMTETESFPFGTVRILEMMKKKKLSEAKLSGVMKTFLEPLTVFIHSNNLSAPLDFVIGTGGNIDALGKLKPVLLNSSQRTSLTLDELNKIIDKLLSMSQKERCEKLDLRPDRADVIIPAGLTVKTVMQNAGLKKLLIPGVGMKDGILWSLV